MALVEGRRWDALNGLDVHALCNISAICGHGAAVQEAGQGGDKVFRACHRSIH